MGTEGATVFGWAFSNIRITAVLVYLCTLSYEIFGIVYAGKKLGITPMFKLIKVVPRVIAIFGTFVVIQNDIISLIEMSLMATISLSKSFMRTMEAFRTNHREEFIWEYTRAKDKTALLNKYQKLILEHKLGHNNVWWGKEDLGYMTLWTKSKQEIFNANLDYVSKLTGLGKDYIREELFVSNALWILVGCDFYNMKWYKGSGVKSTMDFASELVSNDGARGMLIDKYKEGKWNILFEDPAIVGLVERFIMIGA